MLFNHRLFAFFIFFAFFQKEKINARKSQIVSLHQNFLSFLFPTKIRIERMTSGGAHVRFDVPESYPVGTRGYCCRQPMGGARAREREREKEGDSQRNCRNTVASSFGSAATPSARTRRSLYD